MQSSGVLAWFQLADSNQSIFSNSLCNDVLVRTTDESQRILIGPAQLNGSTSTLVVSNSNVTLTGNLNIAEGVIEGDTNSTLVIERVTMSNGKLTSSNIIATSGMTVLGPMQASTISVNGITIVDSSGNFASSNIPDNSLPGSKIVNVSIPTSKYGALSVNTDALSNQSVATAKYALLSINTGAYSNASITSTKFASGSVDSNAIGSQQIYSAHLSTGSVNTSTLSNAAVTSTKLGSNITVGGTTTVLGKLAINALSPSTAALDVNGPLSMTSNNGQIFIYTGNSNLGIRNSNPLYTVDVVGDLNFTGSMWQNGLVQWYPGRWFSPNIVHTAGTGCNLTYMNGYVGINKQSPLQMLHLGGSLGVDSNVNFYNASSTTLPAVTLYTSTSNMGIQQSSPSSTIDIGGSVGIRNTQIITGSRNMLNIHVVSINSNIGINNTSPSLSLDVNGNARFHAKQIVTNSNVMLVSSRGSAAPDTAYYKLLDLKSTSDTANFGAVVIRGDIGHTEYDTGAYVTITLGSRDAQTKVGQAYQTVCQINGASPSYISPLIDLQLFLNADSTFTVYIRTTLNSHFNLEVLGSTVIRRLYHDWEATKSLTIPAGTLQCSLVNNATTFSCSYTGACSIGSNVAVSGFVRSTQLSNLGSFFNSGNITSGACNVRFVDGGLTPMLDIDKISSAARISVNAYRSNVSWKAEKGSMGSLQIDLNPSSLPSGTDGAFYFNTVKTPTNVNDTIVTFSNWMTIRNASLGVNNITNPTATLHVNGHAMFEAASMPTQVLGVFDAGTAIGTSKSVVWGKSNTTNNSAALSFTYQGPGSPSNMLGLGFTNNTTMTILGSGYTGIGKRPPMEMLDVAGNGNFDGFITLATTPSSKRIVNFAKEVQSKTNLSSQWHKLAFLEGKPLTSPYNQCTVNVSGTLLANADAMRFDLLMHVDASNTSANYVQLTYDTNTSNYFLNVFDIVAYVDNLYNIHVYAKCSANYLNIRFDATFQQSYGNGVNIYSGISYSGLVFSDATNPIAALDTSIITPVKFYVNTQTTPVQVRSFLTNGYTGFGTDNPVSRVHVSGTMTTDSLLIQNGTLNTGLSNLIVNGKVLVDSGGTFQTDNIVDYSIGTSKLHPATIAYIQATFGFSNFFPTLSGFGFFSSNPQYPVDVKGPISIRASSNNGSVVLYSSLSNGLGVNVSNPAFTLDVGGHINFNGILYKNREVFYTTQWASSNTSIHYGSNVGIGPGITNPLESLSVNSVISLSNTSGKTLLYSSNGMFGVNRSNPTSTLDVNGTIGVSGTRILHSDMSLCNIKNLSTTSLTATSNMVGINKPSPQFTCDVNGDVNFTGTLFYQGVPHMRQWNGSNMGITYSNNVGIRVAIPTETLSVLSNMSFSNAVGKSVLSLGSNASMLSCSTTFSAPSFAVSNNSGLSWLYSSSSNLGVQTSNPQQTLDVNGSIGISGVNIISNDRTLSNVKNIFSDVFTANNTQVGINWRTPNATLGVNGSFALSNQGYANLNMMSNVLHVSAPSMQTSNIYVNAGSGQPGFTISNNAANLPTIQVTGPTSYMRLNSTNPSSPASFVTFSNPTDFSRIGLDGIGFTSSTFNNMLTLQTSRGMRVLTSSNQTSVTVLENGNIGIQTANPAHSIDLGGNLGMAGSLLVDINKNMYGKVGTFNQIVSSNITTSAFSKLSRNVVDSLSVSGPSIPDGNIGLRYTATDSLSYYTFSNIVFPNPGKVVMVYNDNMYFGGGRTTDASSTYTTFAYQPLRAGTSLSAIPFYMTLDTYVLNDTSINNLIGNTIVAADTMEIVNPTGRTAATTFRMRNWNANSISNTASNSGLDFMEFQIDTGTSSANINTDKELYIKHRGSTRLQISGSTSNVLLPNDTTLSINKLSGSGEVAVYTDNNGKLFKYAGLSSDERMKENIMNLKYGLETITKLRPVNFNWKKDFVSPKTGEHFNLQEAKGSRVQLGLIAQEVRDIIPECVDMNWDDTYVMDYTKLVPVLIKSVQDLALKNERLTEQVATLMSIMK